MIIKDALAWAYQKLNRSSSPQLDAEVLLSSAIKKDKAYIYTHPEKKLTTPQLNKFKKLINKRASYYPVAYLTRSKEFYGLNFFVDARVLVPRPRTENLVNEAIKLIRKYNFKTIADIGTGSGCIAITLKKKFPKLKVYATDISGEALAVARKNAKTYRTKIIFKRGNLLEPIKNIKIDLIVANLPYVNYKTYKKERSIKFEPKKALLAKNKGLEFYYQLIKQAVALTKKPYAIILEAELPQKKDLLKLAKLKLKNIILTTR